jgi:Lrp/AsnC family transcriptional regulator of ectoine degradation
VIGETDYILRFLTTDIDEYQRIIDGLLDRDVGIRNYFSHVRSKAIKNESGSILELLL